MIKYCDFISGNDTTGDGSSGNPYKTITKASTGLTGSDEVRVAKSSAPINLTGTLGFTLNSTAVTGVNTLFTSELAIGDFIKGADNNWWEVITITNNTAAVLYKKYSGPTSSGVSSQKLGITSTGAAAGSTTAIQTISASGSSNESRLKISGGWTLATTTQDGQTYFRQMHATFSYRYGYGLYGVGKSFLEIERLHFLRYNHGIRLITGSNNNIITSPTCNSNSYGLYFDDDNNNTITSPTCNSNTSYGISFSVCPSSTITSPTCNSNGGSGIYLSYSENNTIISPTCKSNTVYGIYFNTCSNFIVTSPTCDSNSSGICLAVCLNSTITSPTCNSNANYGIYFNTCSNFIVTSPTCNSNSYGIFSTYSSMNIVNKPSFSGNITANIYVQFGDDYGDYPHIKCQRYQLTAGDNRCYFEYGITYRDTVDARSGECLKYDPTSGTYYISQSFFFKADSGVSQILSAYIKKEAAFNGDVQGAIFFMGVKITGWTTITPTVNDIYEKKELVAAVVDIIEDGVLELRIKVRGTAGNVFVDDLATV